MPAPKLDDFLDQRLELLIKRYKETQGFSKQYSQDDYSNIIIPQFDISFYDVNGQSEKYDGITWGEIVTLQLLQYYLKHDTYRNDLKKHLNEKEILEFDDYLKNQRNAWYFTQSLNTYQECLDEETAKLLGIDIALKDLQFKFAERPICETIFPKHTSGHISTSQIPLNTNKTVNTIDEAFDYEGAQNNETTQSYTNHESFEGNESNTTTGYIEQEGIQATTQPINPLSSLQSKDLEVKKEKFFSDILTECENQDELLVVERDFDNIQPIDLKDVLNSLYNEMKKLNLNYANKASKSLFNLNKPSPERYKIIISVRNRINEIMAADIPQPAYGMGPSSEEIKIKAIIELIQINKEKIEKHHKNTGKLSSMRNSRLANLYDNYLESFKKISHELDIDLEREQGFEALQTVLPEYAEKIASEHDNKPKNN
ncbi:MAG: hypothetical protein HRT87_09565 [Legionellales bacterium]|nr:hypothetical protein [Legionellales bacterium]